MVLVKGIGTTYYVLIIVFISYSLFCYNPLLFFAYYHQKYRERKIKLGNKREQDDVAINTQKRA